MGCRPKHATLTPSIGPTTTLKSSLDPYLQSQTCYWPLHPIIPLTLHSPAAAEAAEREATADAVVARAAMDAARSDAAARPRDTAAAVRAAADAAERRADELSAQLADAKAALQAAQGGRADLESSREG
eukprot:355692-Chlamydomonas_euryale.AAC.1